MNILYVNNGFVTMVNNQRIIRLVTTRLMAQITLQEFLLFLLDCYYFMIIIMIKEIVSIYMKNIFNY